MDGSGFAEGRGGGDFVGSGFFAIAAVAREIEKLPMPEQVQMLELIGTNILVDVFSNNEWDDFVTDSATVASVVARMMAKSFGDNKFARADVVKVNGRYKVSFFK